MEGLRGRRWGAAALVATLALVGCGGDGDDEAAPGAESSISTTETTAERDDPTTTTERETTTSTTERETTTSTTEAVVETFPVTTSGFAAQINVVGPAAGMETFSATSAGDHLFGGPVTDGAAIYLEAKDQAAPVAAAIVAVPSGSTTLPARIVGMVGGALGDFSVATDVLAAFNAEVLPDLGEITSTETTYHVTEELDLTVLVDAANDNAISFVWTPAGVEPSEYARGAGY